MMPAAFIVLLMQCRGARLGVPVADDYAFRYAQLFHPVDPFDSMGAAFYWRPLSRQLYFAVLGPLLMRAPWVNVTIHAALLLATAAIAYRIARHWLPPVTSAAVGAALLLSEPARVLLAWPSAAQHVMAAFFALLAVHEALIGRMPTAGLAVAAGLLSHESAAVALPLLPMAAMRAGRGREMAAMSVSIAVAWFTGYAMAIRHGVRLPSGANVDVGALAPEVFESWLHAAAAAANAEHLNGAMRVLVVAAIMVLVGRGWTLARRYESRSAHAAQRIAVASTASFLIVTLPLALLPDWNAWRTWVGIIGFNFAAVALIGTVSPWLPLGWVSLRLITLLAAPLASQEVTGQPPVDASDISFRRLTRLQRTVDETRVALLTHQPRIASGSAVCYWRMPERAEFSFHGSDALRVWYDDSTLIWSGFGGLAGARTPFAGGIEYRYASKRFAVPIPAKAIALFQEALRAGDRGQYALSDTLLQSAAGSLDDRNGPFAGSILFNLAINAYNEGDKARVDALLRDAAPLQGHVAMFWGLTAQRAAERGSMDEATTAIRRALTLAPTDPRLMRIGQGLGVAP